MSPTESRYTYPKLRPDYPTPKHRPDTPTPKPRPALPTPVDFSPRHEPQPTAGPFDTGAATFDTAAGSSATQRQDELRR